MKLLIIYHSGAGNTRTIAKILETKLKEIHEIDIYPIEEINNKLVYEDYDGLIIGFPTYHTHPSVSIIKYINSIKKLDIGKPAYIFTTCGWFSANTLRIFARLCLYKNVVPVLYQSYRCTATDGALLAPNIKTFFKFEKKIMSKINNDVILITDTLNSETLIPKIPRFKLISILNYPNKKMGQLITFKIFIHKNYCIKCEKCIKNCNTNAITIGDDGFPIFDKHKCEKCYRCIHHCKNKALSLSKKKIHKKLLTEDFFNSYIKNILN